MNPFKALAKSPPICVLSLLLFCGCNSAESRRETEAQSVAHGIALQSTPAQVLAYLSSRKVVHSEYRRDALKGNSIGAILRYDPSEFRVVHTSYTIEFRFDERDRLIASEVHPKYTGP
jgi:hypothetical protein